MAEQWLPVVGWRGLYEVSNHGRIRSVDRTVVFSDGRRYFYRGTVRVCSPNSSGHMTVRLTNGRKNAVTVRVHRVVLEAFVGPCPDGMQCCHNNGDPADNRLINLRWDTHSSNMIDRVKHGVDPNGRKTHCKQGHEFTADNTYLHPSRTWRACRTCVKKSQKKYAEQHRKGPRTRPKPTHCKWGHSLADAYECKGGKWKCRECTRIKNRRNYQARAAKQFAAIND